VDSGESTRIQAKARLVLLRREIGSYIVQRDKEAASYESYGMSQSTSNESETRIAVLGMSQ
jgi:hypothetical protein